MHKSGPEWKTLLLQDFAQVFLHLPGGMIYNVRIMGKVVIFHFGKDEFHE